MEDEETILARHRKEKKELQAKIQALKKTASKGDKKKRKEVAEEILKLENDLDKTHSEELNEFNSAAKATVDTAEDNPAPTPSGQPTEEPVVQRVSKAQKRRDKKSTAEKERAAEIAAEEELYKDGPRTLENQQFTTILKERNLSLQSIHSDGNCLYNAVIHQLGLKGRGMLTIPGLRDKTANYILGHKAEFISYMTKPETGDILNDDEFKNYCETLRTTPAWGGQVEISALSNILQAQIEVIQASGPPTIQGVDKYPERSRLVITYHRHMYSLGEHYNSTKEFTTDSDQED